MAQIAGRFVEWRIRAIRASVRAIINDQSRQMALKPQEAGIRLGLSLTSWKLEGQRFVLLSRCGATKVGRGAAKRRERAKPAKKQ